MSIVSEAIRRLKDAPKDLKLVLLYDGQYFDVLVSEIRSVYVKKEESMDGLLNRQCYGIADEQDPNSFQVLAIE